MSEQQRRIGASRMAEEVRSFARACADCAEQDAVPTKEALFGTDSDDDEEQAGQPEAAAAEAPIAVWSRGD